MRQGRRRDVRDKVIPQGVARPQRVARPQGVDAPRCPSLPATIPRPGHPVSLRFRLPWPPSVNHYWQPSQRRSRDGRPAFSLKLGDAAKRFRLEAFLALIDQRVQRKNLAGWIEVELIAHPPEGENETDLDNLNKATLDALTHAHVIADDRHIGRLVIERSNDAVPGRLDVSLTAWEASPRDRRA